MERLPVTSLRNPTPIIRKVGWVKFTKPNTGSKVGWVKFTKPNTGSKVGWVKFTKPNTRSKDGGQCPPYNVANK